MHLDPQKLTILAEKTKQALQRKASKEQEQDEALPLSEYKLKFAKRMKGAPILEPFNGEIGHLDPAAMHADYFALFNASLTLAFKGNQPGSHRPLKS